MADYGPGRKNQYFVPGEGIAREVITSDICKYLDNDATVRPFNYQGREGYMVYAYRNLTSAMIEDLKKDTITWEKEKAGRRNRQDRYNPYPSPAATNRSQSHISNSSGASDHRSALEAYQGSQTHERRQMEGPSVPETPSPGLSDGYPPGRGPPPVSYQHPSPQHEAQYGMPHSSIQVAGLPPKSNGPGYQGGYAPADHGPPRNGHDYPPYPVDSGYGSMPMSGMTGPGSVAPGRAYPPQPPQTAPPGPARDPRDPRYDYPDSRGGPPRMDQRQMPPDRMDHARYPMDSRPDNRQYDGRGGYPDAGRYRR